VQHIGIGMKYVTVLPLIFMKSKHCRERQSSSNGPSSRDNIYGAVIIIVCLCPSVQHRYLCRNVYCRDCR